MPTWGNEPSRLSRLKWGNLREPGKRRMSARAPIPCLVSSPMNTSNECVEWPMVNSSRPMNFPLRRPALLHGRGHFGDSNVHDYGRPEACPTAASFLAAMLSLVLVGGWRY